MKISIPSLFALAIVAGTSCVAALPQVSNPSSTPVGNAPSPLLLRLVIGNGTTFDIPFEAPGGVINPVDIVKTSIFPGNLGISGFLDPTITYCGCGCGCE